MILSETALVTCDGITSFEQSKKRRNHSMVKQNFLYSDRSISDTQAKAYITELGAHSWTHVVENSQSVLSLGRLCNETGYSCSWPQEKLPDCQKVRMLLNAASENFVLMLTVTQNMYHVMNSRPSKESLSDTKWRTPHWILCSISRKD